MRKRTKSISMFSIIAFCVACASPKVEIVREIERLSNAGECNAAERLATQNFRSTTLFILKGAIADECKNDRDLAIRYMTVAARAGADPAISWFIDNNLTPPAIERNEQRVAPAPTTTNTTIIVQQPRRAPMGSNLNSCVQDGGSRMCYNRQSQIYRNFK